MDSLETPTIMFNNHINLIYKLEGNFKEGLNVNDLAPLLLNFAELIRNSNDILKITDREIAVNIKPIKKGSFWIDIGIFAKNNAQQILDGISKEQIDKIESLLRIVGMVGVGATTATGSLLWLIKKIKDKPKKITPTQNGYSFVSQTGDQVNVSKQVGDLYQNSTIQKNIYIGYAKPLEDKRTVSVITGEKGKDGEIINEVKSDKKDFESFKNYYDFSLDLLNTKDIEEITHEILLIARANLIGSNFEFKFNGDRIWLEVPEKFLIDFRNRKIQIFPGDALKVKLKSLKDSKTLKLKEREILEVLDIVSEKQPESLFERE